MPGAAALIILCFALVLCVLLAYDVTVANDNSCYAPFLTALSVAIAAFLYGILVLMHQRFPEDKAVNKTDVSDTLSLVTELADEEIDVCDTVRLVTSLADDVCVSLPVGTELASVSLKERFSDRVLIRSVVLRADGGAGLAGQRIRVGGWVRTGRGQGKGTYAFLQLSDGSCSAYLQLIVDSDAADLRQLVRTSTSVHVEGVLRLTPEGTKQKVELGVDKVIHVGTVEDKYPIPKTKLTLEVLRDYTHLRARTSTISSVLRIRDALSTATHTFFKQHHFFHVQTPLITTSDCEGAGEMFQVTTLINEAEKIANDLLQYPPPSEADIEAAKVIVPDKGDQLKSSKPTKQDISSSVSDLLKANDIDSASKFVERSKLKTLIDGKIGYKKDFFGHQAFLTVSGQLQLETLACSLGNVYTFSPTFRAEHSHTKRHLSEFWMVEAELIYADLQHDMDCAEAYVKYMCQWLLEKCLDDMQVMANNVDQTCIDRLRMVSSTPFVRISYKEAIELLEQAVNVDKEKFDKRVEWGIDLASEHERYLTEVKFQKPVIVYNYPKGIKAFYMRLNDDSKTVAAMDVLVPKVGELIGGSQREERFEIIKERILECGLPLKRYEWYLDLRRFGTVEHSGFGLGFERMILFATGLDNIRDAIPFPRFPGRADL